VEWTCTTTQSNDVTPIPEAEVYLSTDAAGQVRTATATADAVGRTVWDVIPGPVRVWESHPLFPDLEENSPRLVTVLADGSEA
jgi:hypothetical protein